MDPEVTSFPVKGGDRLLIASDGLTDAVTDTQIEAVTDAATSAGDACGQLVGTALRGVARDNVTVIVVAFEEEALSAVVS